MASIMGKIQGFLRSPQGQRVVERGRRELSKPGNQHKLRRMVSRFTGRR